MVDTGKYGLVALIPMGMTQVSSVNFEAIIKPGIIHKKGDMLGNFLFGGSDFVMLFQDKAGFELIASKNRSSLKIYTPHQHSWMLIVSQYPRVYQ